LCIDEILLLQEIINEQTHNNYRMLGMLQGHDIGEYANESRAGDDLPAEVLAAEKAWQEKKQKALEEKENVKQELESMGLGYVKK
jgi:hypothetical protein